MSSLCLATCPALRWSVRICAPLCIGTSLALGIRRQQAASLAWSAAREEAGGSSAAISAGPIPVAAGARSGVAGGRDGEGSHRPALLPSPCRVSAVVAQFLAATVIFPDAVLTPQSSGAPSVA